MAKYWKIINQSGHTGRNTPSTHRSFTFWSGGQIRGDWETIFWNQKWINPFFTKMGQSRPLFVYFRSFLVKISIQIETSIDGVLGIRTWGRRTVGADKTTELWWPPVNIYLRLTVEKVPIRLLWSSNFSIIRILYEWKFMIDYLLDIIVKSEW